MLNPFYFLWVCGFRADHYVLDLIESTYKSMSNELFMGAEMIHDSSVSKTLQNMDDVS